MSLTAVRPRPTNDPPRRRSATVRIALWSATHRRIALLAWVLLVLGVLVAGSAAGTRQLSNADSGAGQSRDAERVLDKADFGDAPTETVLVSGHSGTPAARDLDAAAAALRERLGALKEVGDVGATQRSANGTSRAVSVELAIPAGTAPDDADKIGHDAVPALQAVTAQVQREYPGLRVEEVGDASLNRAGDTLVEKDFSRAEITSLPVTLLILVVVFGALVAAAVPVVLALTSVGAAIGLSALASHVMPVDNLVSSVILLVGMAVGVDYSLFYVRREREERRAGADPHTAVERAAETAGHAVLVSGICVIVAMAGLFLSGSSIFVSFGVGTILVVLVAVVGSLTALPALLAMLGRTLDWPRLPFLRRRTPRTESRFWSAVLRPVLRRPALALALGTAALLALASPALGMRLGSPSVDDLPRVVPELRTLDRLNAAFPQDDPATHVVVLSGVHDRGGATRSLTTLAERAEQAPGFAAADRPDIAFSTDGTVARLVLPLTDGDQSTGAEASLDVLRDRLAPQALDGQHWAVTGDTAGSADFDSAVAARLPLVLTFVLGLTFLLLLAAFRAPVVAAVTIGLNLLSVAAAYGVLVLVFQHTWAEGLLDFRSTGSVVSWLPLFSFVILFGLSMDYTVLVVSRVREGLRQGLAPAAAVHHGILRTAGVVTSAAVIMVAVFSIFGTLHLLEFKQLGIGLATAVLLDATVVRAILLPAALAALGDRAWWTPLRRRQSSAVANPASAVSASSN